MRAMRAEGFSGYKDLKLADIPKPAVSDGRVLVRITAAGVTPLEHTILSGGYPRAKAPLVMGGEGAGSAQRRQSGLGREILSRRKLMNTQVALITGALPAISRAADAV